MINPADTAFMLISTALVMFMTPGLALFYAGMVRSKNVLATIMQSFICLGLVSIAWVILGYTLSFGSDLGSLIGGLDYLFLNGVGIAPASKEATIPHLLFCAFQLMFAIITPALITGTFAERMKFSAFLIFVTLWTLLVYAPVCHWVWGGGWLGSLGALDFAGGTVIHINSGAAAVAAALIIGPRKGYRREVFHPHNLPMTVLGGAILWFGWFGFNAGSALAANGTASLAFFNTQIASGAALLSWIMAERLLSGKPTTLGAVSGAVAGLVAITPGAGFVTPIYAVAIGLVGGFLCYLAVLAKVRLGYDDSLDVVAVHGIGGLWGAIGTGLFASVGARGLFFGNPAQLFVQLLGALVTIGFSLVMTSIILKALKATVGLRVDEEHEIQGLDLSLHNETGYNI